MYGRRLKMRPSQWAVSSCMNYSQLCQCGSHLWSHYRFYIEAIPCPRVLCEFKLLPRGKKKKRQLCVLYLYKQGHRQTAEYYAVGVYSEGIDLEGVKCHSVHMGFCIVPGHDEHNTSTPDPHPPLSPAVNEKLPRRGQPSIVAV